MSVYILKEARQDIRRNACGAEECLREWRGVAKRSVFN